MSNLEHKIEARHRCLFDVLNEQKYSVDYFQREYSWEEKHMEELVTDLTSAFLNEFSPEDQRPQVENYNNYYLGPFVISNKSGSRSIIDGQQRLTSLTLFLIYLNHLQETMCLDKEKSGKIQPMIFSEKYGEKSFNITVDERIPCLEALFNEGMYQPSNTDDASTINMSERYQDIDAAFPDEIKGDGFLHFIDWLKYNVIMVEIVAYSDENAYTIFETMNDRGQNLTPSEMLKGFVLSQFRDAGKRQKANALWKKAMMELKAFNDEEDQRFFQAWLKAQYAETIRQSKAGSKNEDFEKIGTRFHSWVKGNLNKMGLTSSQGASFEQFIEQKFTFFLNAYTRILKAENDFDPDLEHLFYIQFQGCGIAPTLSYPLMLAPLNVDDSEAIVCEKMNTVVRYIESFVVRRSVNFRTISASSIRYTMLTLVKEIRGKSLVELKELLTKKLEEMEYTFEGVDSFRMHGQNKRFVRFLLSRMTAWVEQESGRDTSFSTYFKKGRAKPFQVEHIWANQFTQHSDEFDQEHEFSQYRNRLGGLVLLPEGTNQSYGSLPYQDKHEHYIKENLLVQSLCPLTYSNNPNFLKLKNSHSLPFQPHPEFKKDDLQLRQQLYRAICERIWPDHLD